MQAEVARVAPAAAVAHPARHPGPGPAGRHRRDAAQGGHPRGRARPAVHRRGPAPLLPPARRRHRSPGRPGLARLNRGPRARLATITGRRPGGEPACGPGADRRRRAAAGRDPSAVRAARGEQDLARGRRPGARRARQRDFGENRAQELLAKAAELADLPLRWHFIGQLQRNKAAAVAPRSARVVHSVDRPSLVARPRPGRPGRDRPRRGAGAGRPRGSGGRAGRPRGSGAGRRAGARRPRRGAARPAAARAHGGRAARRGPGAGVRAAWPRSPLGCGPTIRRPWSSRRA